MRFAAFGGRGDRGHHTLRAVDEPNKPCGAASRTTMNSANTATEEKMPPTRKFAACWNRPSARPPMIGATVIAESAQRHRHEAVEIQKRAIGEERQQQLAAGKSGNAADDPGERVAGDAQIAFGQTQCARGEIVLRDRQERAAHQRPAIQIFEADDGDRAGDDRQPELFVPDPASPPDQAGKRLRFGAPFDRRHLLDHQRQRQRRKHVEMLVEALEHRPHRDELGDHPDDRAPKQRQKESDQDRQAHLQHEHRAEHAAEHGELAGGETHHPRGREHGVVGDADERVDRASRKTSCENRGEHLMRFPQP